MCGIAGICHITEPIGVSMDTLSQMTGVILHRGPDETDIYLDDHVELGHARLSIIDLLAVLRRFKMGMIPCW